MEYRLDEPLVDHIGGVDKAIYLLEYMRSVGGNSYWRKFKEYGKGRAAKKVVGHYFDVVSGGVDWKYRDLFNVKQLESALEQRLHELGMIVSPQSKLAYNDVSVLPTLRAERERYHSPYWDTSPPMVIKYNYDGKVCHVMGNYQYSTHPDEYPDQFHLEGHGGNWQDKIIGWAYV